MKVAQLLEVLDETSMLELLKKVVEREGYSPRLVTTRNRPCLIVPGQFSTRSARIVLDKDKQLWKVTILTGQGHKVKEGEGDEAQVLELIKQLKYGGRKPVAEALSVEQQRNLMLKLLVQNGYDTGTPTVYGANLPAVRLPIYGHAFHILPSSRTHTWSVFTFKLSTGARVGEHTNLDEDGVLNVIAEYREKYIQLVKSMQQALQKAQQKVSEALDEEHMLRLMVKLLRTKGYPDAAMFKLTDRDPYIRVDIGDTKIQMYYDDREGRDPSWVLAFFTGVGNQVTREVYADEDEVLRELDRLSKKVTEAKTEDTLAHTFGRMVKKMAASDRGLWVYAKFWPFSPPEHVKITNVEELEAGGYLMFRVHVKATNYTSRKKVKPVQPTWFELDDNDDQQLQIGEHNGKRTLLGTDGSFFRV